MRLCLYIALVAACGQLAPSQDLTVKLVDERNDQPVSNAIVRLHYGCWHSMRPIEQKQRTDTTGVAVFHSVSLEPLEFCLFPDYAYTSQERGFIFTSPDHRGLYSKYDGRIVTELPSSVTFHVRRLSLHERIRNIFRYD
jgi:hypothetical protein